MKNFVKIIAIVMAMLLLVAFVACGTKDEVDTDTEASDTSDVIDSGSDTAAESDSESESESESESDSDQDSETVETFRISIGTDNGSGWEDYNEIDN